MMQSLLKKAAIISAIIVIYFLGIRHLRQVAVSVLMGSLLPPDYGMVNKEIEFYSQSTVSFTFTTPTSDSNGWNFKMPFDSFFLFALIGFVTIGAVKKWYIWLLEVHFFGGIASMLFVLLGIHSHYNFLIIPDFISRYLFPLFSLGLVALALVHKKGTLNE